MARHTERMEDIAMHIQIGIEFAGMFMPRAYKNSEQKKKNFWSNMNRDWMRLRQEDYAE